MPQPKIVYLHGFASGPSSHKARFFKDRFREIGIQMSIPDLAQGDFEHLTVSRQLEAIDTAVAGNAVSLIGSSLGAYLAALYAARHENIQKVVLLAPAFGFARRWAESLGRKGLEDWKTAGFIEVHHFADKRNRRIAPDIIDDGLKYEDYPNFSQPAIIFHGEKDRTVLPVYSEEFANRHTNARLEMLESDHQLLDVINHIWQRVRAFLK